LFETDPQEEYLSPGPSIHFEMQEFADRQAATREALAERGMDGLIVSRIEDQYWLCGLDTEGFCIFHALFIGVEGALTHVTRTADLPSIEYSSICDDVRVWEDREGNSKADAIKRMLDSHGMRGRRVGIQTDTFGMLPDLYLALQAALEGWCELVPVADLPRTLRLVKSDRELAYHRKAGEILGKMRDAAIEATAVGAFEGDIMGRILATGLANDGDPPAHRLPMGSGDSALNVRYFTGRGTVRADDQVTYELATGYRHYHTANMFGVLTGPRVDPRHLKMHEACVDALDSVQVVLRAGTTLGEVYEVHRRTLTRHGFEHALLRACGYTMGATWPPSWMEQPMIFADSSVVLQPNMILTDREARLMMSLGEQAIITDGRPEIISHVPREPITV
jgi:Xaa-Pro dipeptidase